MKALWELIENDQALTAGVLTAFTGLLTGPVFKMDPAAVGSIVGLLGLLLTVWVRAQVYSKKGAAQAATVAATEAVKAVTTTTVGAVGEVTAEAQQVILDAVSTAVPGVTAAA